MDGRGAERGGGGAFHAAALRGLAQGGGECGMERGGGGAFHAGREAAGRRGGRPRTTDLCRAAGGSGAGRGAGREELQGAEAVRGTGMVSTAVRGEKGRPGAMAQGAGAARRIA